MNYLSSRTFLIPAICIVVLFSTMVGACDSSGENSSETALIPLTEGTKWTARVEFDGGDQMQLIAEITGAGEAVLSNSGVFPIYSQQITFEEREDGFLFETGVRNSGGGGVRSMLLKYPVETGDSYLYTQSNRDWSVNVSEETQVTVPAGTFDCIVYTIRNEEFGEDHRVWIAPGVGPVRWLRDDDGFSTEEFEFDYQLISTNADS